jgi:hypothetical protein
VILSILLRPPGAPPEGRTTRVVDSHRRVLPGVRERTRRYDRALAVGLIVSVVVHILIVRLSPLLVRYLEPDMGIYTPVRIVIPRQGTQVVELVVTEDPVVPEIEPLPEPEPEPPPAVEGPTIPTATPAERLRPTVGDWRLWVVPPLARRHNLTPEEQLAVVRARLYALLETYDDSVAAELASELEALDWTLGEEGKEWGLSPGKIHLGGLTLPLPLYFGPHPAWSREQEDRNADYDAIQRQAGQGVIDDTFEERVRAIRERKEREEAQRDTTGNG